MRGVRVELGDHCQVQGEAMESGREKWNHSVCVWGIETAGRADGLDVGRKEEDLCAGD